jgi:hypothetical protein
MGGIVGSALLLAGLIAIMRSPAAPAETDPKNATQSLIQELAAKSAFQDWLAGWAEEDKYVTAGEFALTGSEPLPATSPQRPVEDADQGEPRRSRLIVGPSEGLFADLDPGLGGAAATLAIASGDATVRTYATREKPGYWQAGLWLDGTRFAVLGSLPEKRADGSRLCLSDSAGVPLCYYRLTLDILDFAARRHDLYLSEKHGFPGDPFRADIERAHLASLSDEESLASGIVPPDALHQSVSGMLSVLGPDSLNVVADSRTVGVRLTGRTRYLDKDGRAVAAGYLQPGLSVTVTGAALTDGRLVATGVTVTDAPAIIVSVPSADQPLPGGVFEVRGLASAGIERVAVKLKSRRTGETLAALEVVFLPGDEPWQGFRATVTPKRALAPNEPVSLLVYDPTDLEKGVTLRLSAMDTPPSEVKDVTWP